MTQEERNIKKDRMRYTKDKFSSNLVMAAIVLDALYFVSIYKTDVGTYYYTWVIGASIIYNLLFMLTAFLASEGIKSRKGGYTPMLTFIGLMQFVRIFYLPARAREAVVVIQEVEHVVMSANQHLFAVACLAISGICCIAGGISSYINSKTLASYIRSLENGTV